MRILVLSDSHSAMRFMGQCVEAIQPEAIIHLGDYYDDGEALKEAYPQIPLYQVPGNCDRYRCPPGTPEILIPRIGGVDFYLTHGHRHQVKQLLSRLLADARACKVAAVLYGHTHEADLHREEDGLWVMNPGTSGYYGGSAGLITIENGAITKCRIIRPENLEEEL